MKTRNFFYYAKFGVLGIAGLILFTFVVMWLWNWLVPELFSGPVVTYWQTLGILILSKILFSGVGKGQPPGHRSKYSREFASEHRDRWRRKFEEKMNGKAEGADDEEEVIVKE